MKATGALAASLVVGLMVVALLCAGGAAQAGTITVSATVPTIDEADIAMLNTTGAFDPGGNEGHIWSNRPSQGQTFTTGSASGGYNLSSVTLRDEENNINNNASPFTVRVGTVSGNTFTPIHTESSTNTISYVTNDFMTFNFTAPVALSANTVYAFDWDASGSGFTTWANADTNYGGGTGFSINNNDATNTMQWRNLDRVFHADMALAADGTLTSIANTNWNLAGTWTGGPPNVPTAMTDTIVDGETVTVAAPGLAGSVSVTAGGVNVNSTLTVSSNVDVQSGGALSIGAGGTLKTDTGTLQAVTTGAAGTSTLENSGDVTATQLAMSGTATFVKDGAGKLSLTTGTNTIGANNTVQVNAGELAMQSASNPMGSGDLVLSGGTFTVAGATAPITGGKFVRVRQNLNEPLNMAEIQVFETGTGDNVALSSVGGLASQSSTGSGGSASRGNDGNTDGNWGGGSVQHTNSGVGQWWQVELASATDLDAVHVWSRTDCCWNRVDNFNLIISDASSVELYNEQITGVGSGPDRNRRIDVATIDAVDMTATNITVTADSTLNAVTPSTAAFGKLTLQSGALKTKGPGGGMRFTGMELATGATAVGLDTEVDTTLGPLQGNNVAATIVKKGEADLILNQDAAGGMGKATFALQEGRLKVEYASNPLGGAGVTLNAGGALTLQGAAGASIPNRLDAYAYNVSGNNGDNRLDEIGTGGANSVLLASPISHIVIDGSDRIDYRNDTDFNTGDAGLNAQGFRVSLDGLPGLNQSDNYATVFRGQLIIPDLLGGGTPYNVEFGTNRADDPAQIYVDLNQNGTFEAPGSGGQSGERVVDRACCGNAFNTLVMAPGTYNYLATHLERGGGSQIEPTIDLTPDAFGRRTVEPGAASQAGMWASVGFGALNVANTITIDVPAAAMDTGLLGEYYTRSGDNPGTFKGSRIDLTSGEFYFPNDPGGGNTSFADGPWGRLEDNFFVRWTGMLDVPQDGTYNFRMNTDDRSRMFIDVDGDSVLEAAPGQPAWTVNWTGVTLTAGNHAVEFNAIEYGGGDWTRVEWELPGTFGWQTIPASVLSTLQTPSSTLELITDMDTILGDLDLLSGQVLITGGNDLTVQQLEVFGDSTIVLDINGDATFDDLLIYYDSVLTLRGANWNELGNIWGTPGTPGGPYTAEFFQDHVTLTGIGLQPYTGEIPEPATMAMLGMALAGLGGYIRRRRRA